MLSAAAWSTYEISRCEISRWAARECQSLARSPPKNTTRRSVMCVPRYAIVGTRRAVTGQL